MEKAPQIDSPTCDCAWDARQIGGGAYNDAFVD